MEIQYTSKELMKLRHDTRQQIKKIKEEIEVVFTFHQKRKAEIDKAYNAITKAHWKRIYTLRAIRDKAIEASHG